jgi:hypothetical protein
MIAGQGLRGTVPDNAGGGITVSASPPSSSLTNRVWLRVDSVGRPWGIYSFYNGSWRKVYTGAVGDIKFYSGPWNGVFDGAGRGIPGGIGGVNAGNGAYDEDGWQICNGNNGAPNLSDFFIVPANVEGQSSGSGPWQSNWDGQGQRPNGGQRRVPPRINQANLPQLLTSGIKQYPNGTGATGGIGFLTEQGTEIPFTIAGTGANNPIPTVPWIAFAALMYIGYA